LDTSLITSARKRRGTTNRQQQPDKRRRPDPEAAQLNFDEAAAANDGVGLSQDRDGQQLEQQEQQLDAGQAGQKQAKNGTIFSPTFQPAREQGGDAAPDACPQPGGHAACSQPDTPLAEAVSTDSSTGTSASLELESDCDVRVARLVSPGALVPVASPPPPAADQQHLDDDDDDEDYCDFDPLLFIKRLPPLAHCVPERRTFLLPRQTRRCKKKTLVLDLDETLVHSSLDGGCIPDFTFTVELGPARHIVWVRKRPHLHAFLNRVAQLFEVVVFTASQRVYAEQLLDIIDPGRILIRHRIYRESCVFWEGNYLKDLTVLGRDLAHTLIVDNSPQAFGFQVDNGVPIESWYDNDADVELPKLLPFLEEVARSEDVRPHIERKFKLRQCVEAAGRG
jgi:CTD small phosphatase-like protein 2